MPRVFLSTHKHTGYQYIPGTSYCKYNAKAQSLSSISNIRFVRCLNMVEKRRARATQHATNQSPKPSMPKMIPVFHPPYTSITPVSHQYYFRVYQYHAASAIPISHQCCTSIMLSLSKTRQSHQTPSSLRQCRATIPTEYSKPQNMAQKNNHFGERPDLTAGITAPHPPPPKKTPGRGRGTGDG